MQLPSVQVQGGGAKVLPPTCEIWGSRCCSEGFIRYAEEVLLHHPMEKQSLALTRLDLIEWLRFNRGPQRVFEVAQLKATRTIQIVLQRGLAEREDIFPGGARSAKPVVHAWISP